MKKILTFLISTACLFSTPLFTEEGVSQEKSAELLKDEVQFTPPSGWRYAEAGKLPKSVKIMVVGTGQHEFPPSMNLGTETFQGSLKDYLKVVKGVNDARHADWKDLGTIRTEAGNASLSQADMKTEWGDVRMMHVILLHDGTVYILTAAALKDEFPSFYKDFFKSMTSLKIQRLES